MNELSLFAGAGGGLLGSKLLGWRCVGYVENNIRSLGNGQVPQVLAMA